MLRPMPMEVEPAPDAKGAHIPRRVFWWLIFVGMGVEEFFLFRNGRNGVSATAIGAGVLLVYVASQRRVVNVFKRNKRR